MMTKLLRKLNCEYMEQFTDGSGDSNCFTDTEQVHDMLQMEWPGLTATHQTDDESTVVQFACFTE